MFLAGVNMLVFHYPTFIPTGLARGGQSTTRMSGAKPPRFSNAL
jgi:hypothetical protein